MEVVAPLTLKLEVSHFVIYRTCLLHLEGDFSFESADYQ